MEGFGGSKGVNPESSEIRPFFCLILVVYPGHGMFHEVELLSSSFIFLQISFCLREVSSSRTEEPQKKSGAPIS